MKPNPGEEIGRHSAKASVVLLDPFLASLSGSNILVGIDDYKRISLALAGSANWTLPKLRYVLAALLVRDSGHEQEFEARFDAFFREEGQIGVFDLKRALSDLQATSLESVDGATRQPFWEPMTLTGQPWKWGRTAPSLVAKLLHRIGRSRKTPAVLLLALSAFAFAAMCLKLWSARSAPDPQGGGGGGFAGPPIRFAQVPWIEVLGILAGWVILSLLVAGLVTWCFDLLRLHGRKTPETLIPGARMFQFIHDGLSDKQLDTASLDRLARLISYFQTRDRGSRLDLAASTYATVRRGGLPSLVYRKPRRLQTVLILQDTFSDLIAWDRNSKELAKGLANRGLEIIEGDFHGSPEQFRTADGQRLYLSDLESDQGSYVVLVFSDGHGLSRDRHKSLLRSLALQPLVSWIELRDPHLWDERTAFVRQSGIPVYASTPSGIESALTSAMTGRSAGPSASNLDGNSCGMAALGLELSSQLEALLLDALPWAQACSMIQPLNPDIAEELRQGVDPGIEPSRIKNLLALPGTATSVSGIWFSRPVLIALRRSFFSQWTDERQEEILRSILATVLASEPSEAGSLSHLKWRWVLQRTRLDLEPDDAIRELAELWKTPLRCAIEEYLESLEVTALVTARPAEGKIPLRKHLSHHARSVLLAMMTADENTLNQVSGSAVGLGRFDARIPIGLFFLLEGGLLTCYGLMTNGDSQLYEKSLSINLNILWGGGIMLFGAIMLGASKRAWLGELLGIITPKEESETSERRDE
ncbi:MAG TPA: hypothetical protein VJX67_07355 [Blastocatellia bacterium]|nr:hypothetical protein [Blastocatellia bacterium]